MIQLKSLIGPSVALLAFLGTANCPAALISVSITGSLVAPYTAGDVNGAQRPSTVVSNNLTDGTYATTSSVGGGPSRTARARTTFTSNSSSFSLDSLSELINANNANWRAQTSGTVSFQVDVNSTISFTSSGGLSGLTFTNGGNLTTGTVYTFNFATDIQGAPSLTVTGTSTALLNATITPTVNPPVPEPSSLAILSGMVCALSSCRFRRRAV